VLNLPVYSKSERELATINLKNKIKSLKIIPYNKSTINKKGLAHKCANPS
jgi:hypothetical protein